MRAQINMSGEDLKVLSTFWESVLGYTRLNETTTGYVVLTPHIGDGVVVAIREISAASMRPGGTTHLDLVVDDLEAELERIVGLGAVLVSTDPHQEFGWTWFVLRDPAGNDFCLAAPVAPSGKGATGTASHSDFDHTQAPTNGR